MKKLILLCSVFLNFIIANDENMSNIIIQIPQIINFENKKTLIETKRNVIEKNSTTYIPLEDELKKLKLVIEDLEWNIKQCELSNAQIKDQLAKTQSQQYNSKYMGNLKLDFEKCESENNYKDRLIDDCRKENIYRQDPCMRQEYRNDNLQYNQQNLNYPQYPRQR